MSDPRGATFAGMPRGQVGLSYARYRLLFKHPFATAHGVREGTDAVFVRLERDGLAGYGEATIPPYLEWTADAVVQLLEKVHLDSLEGQLEALLHQQVGNAAWQRMPPVRAALTSAYFDLVNKGLNRLYSSSLEVESAQDRPGSAMVTLGLSDPRDIEQRIGELPDTEVLKVKLDRSLDGSYVKRVMSLTDRRLFLDVNQGWTAFEQATAMLDGIDQDRILGIEQPFRKDCWDLHSELQRLTGIPIYGDESIQGPADLERAAGVFGGVNIKLMKCGGLDVAERMVDLAGRFGMRIMLGCMSESSLGCAVMAQLAGRADLVDLDGPWLLRNDPFQGLGLEQGQMRVHRAVGFGVEPVPGWRPEWTRIVA